MNEREVKSKQQYKHDYNGYLPVLRRTLDAVVIHRCRHRYVWTDLYFPNEDSHETTDDELADSFPGVLQTHSSNTAVRCSVGSKGVVEPRSPGAANGAEWGQSAALIGQWQASVLVGQVCRPFNGVETSEARLHGKQSIVTE